MKHFRLSLLLIAAIILTSLSACSNVNKNGHKIENFTFTDQNGEKLGLKDLKGNVWVADFMFTSCADICPQLTKYMRDLQKEIKKKGYDDVHFVSFSVDPEVDKPKALKNYASKFEADFSTWHLLTEYSQDKIKDFAMDNFKNIIVKPENDTQVVHGTSFYLVNKDGEVVKDYSTQNGFPLSEIVKDIKALR
ncbi:SCO family protein [Bacillus sporothermodurans]|uniref:SCO family protein n=1 Tax=Heyndrickxia sporothermodurans TaxID=46224 RepID=UPI00192B5F0C|nr:SCO family protein [Heyndrickxia sporothermodurans]MBL5801596.1 SCO family protein [Heyndrickxia sporothermodurans]MBL5812698.1 SCO family protein [Heyndrickxia sporothermodurans]MBL5816116.1 SCO family protein [Heyndrickxia sporothermodurans]MBL5819573.1 SCO family protein [Heyndrickxia sporothermodurans]MBL5844675.1 SCO family protein [Heyndrickxia sporothermodurans]